MSNDHCTDIDRDLIFKILTNPARVKLIFPYIKSSISGKLASGNSMVDKDDKVGNKAKYRKKGKGNKDGKKEGSKKSRDFGLCVCAKNKL